MKIIAHRGLVNEAVENSFRAFDLAVEAGADRIELDVQFTADQEMIIMHDADLVRTAARTNRVDQITRADCKQWQLKGNAGAIPFLDEVVERYLDKIELNIEIKGNNGAIGRKVAQLLRQHRHRDRVIVSSFHPEPLLNVRDLSDIKIACLLSYPESWPLTGPTDPVNFMNLVGARIAHPHTLILNDNFMDQAVRRGWEVNSYCRLKGSQEQLDPNRLWSALLTWGVDGHCTNFARELKHWMMKVDGFQILHKEAQQQLEC